MMHFYGGSRDLLKIQKATGIDVNPKETLLLGPWACQELSENQNAAKRMQILRKTIGFRGARGPFENYANA